MNENLRPVDTDDAMHHAAVEAGYASLPDLVAPKHQHEINLLDGAAKAVQQAITELRAGYAVAARLEISHASRLLDRAFHGEAV